VVEAKGDGIAKGGEFVPGAFWHGAFLEELKELDQGVGKGDGQGVKGRVAGEGGT